MANDHFSPKLISHSTLLIILIRPLARFRRVSKFEIFNLRLTIAFRSVIRSVLVAARQTWLNNLSILMLKWFANIWPNRFRWIRSFHSRSLLKPGRNSIGSLVRKVLPLIVMFKVHAIRLFPLFSLIVFVSPVMAFRVMLGELRRPTMFRAASHAVRLPYSVEDINCTTVTVDSV